MAAAERPDKTLGTVLVVGGCGFLGSHVVNQLLNFPRELNTPPSSSSLSASPPADPVSWTFPSLRSRYPSFVNTTVHVLDLRCVHNRYDGAFYHEADITSPDALLEVFKTVKPDILINTASPQYSAPKDVLHKVNVEGTRTLLEVASGKHGSWGGTCRVFVHTSSSSVIHDAVSPLVNADETYPYVLHNTLEYYSETKARAEQLVLAANNSPEYNGLLTCAIRPAGIIGEGDRGGMGPGFLETARVAPSWQLHFQLGEGDNLFDITYVGNVAYGLLLAAEGLQRTFERRESGKAMPLEHEKIDGEAFIVTNDSPLYFWDIARFYWSAYGRTINLDKIWVLPTGAAYYMGILGEAISFMTGRKGKLTRQNVKYMSMQRYYSCEKAKSRCGYLPLVDIQEGLRREVSAYVKEERATQTSGGDEKKAQ